MSEFTNRNVALAVGAFLCLTGGSVVAGNCWVEGPAMCCQILGVENPPKSERTCPEPGPPTPGWNCPDAIQTDSSVSTIVLTTNGGCKRIINDPTQECKWTVRKCGDTPNLCGVVLIDVTANCQPQRPNTSIEFKCP